MAQALSDRGDAQQALREVAKAQSNSDDFEGTLRTLSFLDREDKHLQSSIWWEQAARLLRADNEPAALEAANRISRRNDQEFFWTTLSEHHLAKGNVAAAFAAAARISDARYGQQGIRMAVVDRVKGGDFSLVDQVVLRLVPEHQAALWEAVAKKRLRERDEGRARDSAAKGVVATDRISLVSTQTFWWAELSVLQLKARDLVGARATAQRIISAGNPSIESDTDLMLGREGIPYDRAAIAKAVLGDHEGARRDASRWRDSPYESAQAKLASIQILLGDSVGAIAMADAVNTSENTDRIWFGIASSQLTRSQYREALAALSKTLYCCKSGLLLDIIGAASRERNLQVVEHSLSLLKGDSRFKVTASDEESLAVLVDRVLALVPASVQEKTGVVRVLATVQQIAEDMKLYGHFLKIANAWQQLGEGSRAQSMRRLIIVPEAGQWRDRAQVLAKTDVVVRLDAEVARVTRATDEGGGPIKARDIPGKLAKVAQELASELYSIRRHR